jgi:hypothetical protein
LSNRINLINQMGSCHLRYYIGLPDSARQEQIDRLIIQAEEKAARSCELCKPRQKTSHADLAKAPSEKRLTSR